MTKEDNFNYYYLVWWVDGNEKSPEQTLMGIHTSVESANVLLDKIKGTDVVLDSDKLYITQEKVNNNGEVY